MQYDSYMRARLENTLSTVVGNSIKVEYVTDREQWTPTRLDHIGNSTEILGCCHSASRRKKSLVWCILVGDPPNLNNFTLLIIPGPWLPVPKFTSYPAFPAVSSPPSQLHLASSLPPPSKSTPSTVLYKFITIPC